MINSKDQQQIEAQTLHPQNTSDQSDPVAERTIRAANQRHQQHLERLDTIKKESEQAYFKFAEQVQENDALIQELKTELDTLKAS